jgi:hypothetical protein
MSNKARKTIGEKAFEGFVRPTTKKSNVPDRRGYDKKERGGMENLLEKTE